MRDSVPEIKMLIKIILLKEKAHEKNFEEELCASDSCIHADRHHPVCGDGGDHAGFQSVTAAERTGWRG